ncbi:MAG: hypothetical protein IJ598_02535 [Ruminococcus sp.]|nr:hypothetical protein [Ruminococcus sp.]
MKKIIYRLIKISALGLAVLATLFLLQRYILCHQDHNRLRLDGFYLEEKDSLDVVFTGASESYSDFSPGLAYEKFGFTSYPYASASVTAGAAVTQIKEILRTQSPQLIVMEINPFLYPDDSNEKNEGSIRNYIDNVPLNQNKIDYIKSLNTENELEYFIPVIKYHDCWTEYPGGIKFLGAQLIQDFRGYTLLKGYKSNTFSCSEEGYLNSRLINDTKEVPLTADSETKLKELLKFLNDNDIKNVLFIRAPHLIRQNDYECFCMANYAGNIIKEYGFDFINFERDEVTMNYPASDYYNIQHLNIYGSEKFTEYFGSILTKQYGVQQTAKTAAQQQQWQKASAYYHAFYLCCKDKMNSGINMEINEDLIGINEIKKYETNG